MARKKGTQSRIARTTYATSGYRSNMRAASTSSGGSLGRGVKQLIVVKGTMICVKPLVYQQVELRARCFRVLCFFYL